MLGPQGIGALLITPELASALEPVICGGTGSASHLLTMPEFMPDKFEAGTLNLPGIIGLNASLKYIESLGTAAIFEKEKKLAQSFIEKIDSFNDEGAGIRIVGTRDWSKRLSTVSLDFNRIDNAEVSFGFRIRNNDPLRTALRAAGSPDAGNLPPGHGEICLWP